MVSSVQNNVKVLVFLNGVLVSNLLDTHGLLAVSMYGPRRFVPAWLLLLSRWFLDGYLTIFSLSVDLREAATYSSVITWLKGSHLSTRMCNFCFNNLRKTGHRLNSDGTEQGDNRLDSDGTEQGHRLDSDATEQRDNRLDSDGTEQGHRLDSDGTEQGDNRLDSDATEQGDNRLDSDGTEQGHRLDSVAQNKDATG